MFKYSSFYINFLSLVISIVIFVGSQIFFSNYEIFTQKSSIKAGFNVENQKQNDTEEKNSTEEFLQNNVETKEILEQTEEWYLEIPKINLKANIQEGTSAEVMEEFIGHFEETQKEVGNVGLAAHNRGYKNNYFKNIKSLESGDFIYYNYHRKYKRI